MPDDPMLFVTYSDLAVSPALPRWSGAARAPAVPPVE